MVKYPNEDRKSKKLKDGSMKHTINGMARSTFYDHQSGKYKTKIVGRKTTFNKVHEDTLYNALICGKKIRYLFTAEQIKHVAKLFAKHNKINTKAHKGEGLGKRW
jgi:hypothetical protein